MTWHEKTLTTADDSAADRGGAATERAAAADDSGGADAPVKCGGASGHTSAGTEVLKD